MSLEVETGASPIIQGPIRRGCLFDQKESPSKACLLRLEVLLIRLGAPREACSGFLLW